MTNPTIPPIELLPCPFCGGLPIHELTVTEEVIRCTICDARLHFPTDRNCAIRKPGASARWNTRAHPTPEWAHCKCGLPISRGSMCCSECGEQSSEISVNGSGTSALDSSSASDAASASRDDNPTAPATDQPDECREAFERWIEPLLGGLGFTRCNEGYFNTVYCRVNDQWEIWKAAWNARPKRESSEAQKLIEKTRDFLSNISIGFGPWDAGASELTKEIDSFLEQGRRG